ncbi:hypothetical protein DIPPA_08410 [Diplonema papillatum]|nr:hypothetical protein DIPPA_08410 [Diplonema papillatum]
MGSLAPKQYPFHRLPDTIAQQYMQLQPSGLFLAGGEDASEPVETVHVVFLARTAHHMDSSSHINLRPYGIVRNA